MIDGTWIFAATETVQLFNDWQNIQFVQIGCVLGVCGILIALTQWLLPFFADVVPSRFRLYFLAAVPVIRLALITVAILWIIPLVFNVTFENFLVIAGGASVAIGFAFKDYVSSLIAGVVAVFERPYRPGDWVRIGQHYGEVRSVGLRAISMRTPTDDMVTIPHLAIWTNHIANSNNGERTLMCVADFYISVAHDAMWIRSRLRDVALTSAYLDYGRPINVVVVQQPWGTHYKVKAYPFDMRDQFELVSDVTIRGKQMLMEEGILEPAVPVVVHSQRET
ncbi:MAG: mechanosensitive ion channel [Planctomycetales bacterium]|nr:mechanosensitive ion channel [Planctomycetales bacterium]